MSAALCVPPILLPPFPSNAALSGSNDAEIAGSYAAGARASGGRGAATMMKTRAVSGVQRVGSGDPLFAAGSILDTVRAFDGSAVDISFAFPGAWTVAKGPNLDVRDVKTADSAYLLVAPLPKGKRSVEDLRKDFFTEQIFAKEGKYVSFAAAA